MCHPKQPFPFKSGMFKKQIVVCKQLKTITYSLVAVKLKKMPSFGFEIDLNGLTVITSTHTTCYTYLVEKWFKKKHLFDFIFRDSGNCLELIF